jgi:hypothetical protein
VTPYAYSGTESRDDAGLDRCSSFAPPIKTTGGDVAVMLIFPSQHAWVLGCLFMGRNLD